MKHQDSAAIATLMKERVDLNAPQPDGARRCIGRHTTTMPDGRGAGSRRREGQRRHRCRRDAAVGGLHHERRARATIRLLLAAGANPNLAPNTGETPLMWCARTGALDSVKALSAAAPMSTHAKERRSDRADVGGRRPPSRLVKTLLEAQGRSAGADEGHTELVYKGFRYITAPPASRKASSITRNAAASRRCCSRRSRGTQESAELLLAAGADVNDIDASGSSVLVVAAHSGHGALGRLLLDRGADPNAAGAGYTALHAAVLRGDAELVRALLAKGADPNAPLKAGTPVRKYGVDYALSAAWIGATPYWLAAKFAEPEIMRLLAEGRADTRRAMPDGTRRSWQR